MVTKRKMLQQKLSSTTITRNKPQCKDLNDTEITKLRHDNLWNPWICKLKFKQAEWSEICDSYLQNSHVKSSSVTIKNANDNMKYFYDKYQAEAVYTCTKRHMVFI